MDGCRRHGPDPRTHGRHWTGVADDLVLLRTSAQSPITLKKEVSGFVLNRLQYALLMEAWRLVEVWC